MKASSQKTLLLLYPTTPQPVALPTTVINLLLPELTPGGRRSLLHHLQAQKYLYREEVVNTTYLSLTNKAIKGLEALFPALQPKWDTWNGELQILVFLRAPQGDPQFRYLRNLLISEGAISISRGVYAAAGEFSARVLSECQNTYAGSVVVCSVAEWIEGSPRELLLQEFAVGDFAGAYSGISREISVLLEKCKSNVRLVDRDILAFDMVFSRFWEIIADDAGFGSFYYPQASNAKIVLRDLQELAAAFLAANR